jgi:hypothetical protein
MLNTRGRPQKMGSRRGELARSQALLRASIAMSAARRCVPVAEGPPTGAYVRVRPAALRQRDQNGGRLLWIGLDRPSVRELWLLRSTELTFVFERLL